MAHVIRSLPRTWKTPDFGQAQPQLVWAFEKCIFILSLFLPSLYIFFLILRKKILKSNTARKMIYNTFPKHHQIFFSLSLSLMSFLLMPFSFLLHMYINALSQRMCSLNQYLPQQCNQFYFTTLTKYICIKLHCDNLLYPILSIF